MTGLWTIAKRELLGYFYAPIAYVVGVAFLALQGFSFWALMRSLSDASQAAEAGAVLRSFFGGTLLHWFTVFALLALLSMRSVSEDRRSGAWEATLTTRVGAGTVLIGKWIALVVFYLLLWVPSIFLIFVFTRYLPEGQALDLGPVLASYLGIAFIGAALLALGVAVSTATENQIIAAVVSFSLFLAWLMLGEYGSMGGDGHAATHWFFAVDLRQSLALMARGELALVTFLSLAAVVLVSLTLASALAARARQEKVRLLVATFCLCVAGASAAQLAGKHGKSLDWSASRSNSLEASTEAVLDKLSDPSQSEVVEVVLVRPSEQVFDSVHAEVLRLLRRMQRHQSLLVIREVDPLAQPDKLREWAFELAIRPEDLSSGGAVIFQQGNSRQVIDLLAMASFGSDDLGVGALAGFRAESAFREAIIQLTRKGGERLCISTGHGEMAAIAGPTGWAGVATRLEESGVVIAALRVLTRDNLARCNALVVMGAQRSFAADELIALRDYWNGGGHALIAMRSRPEPGARALPSTQLSLLLSERGMQVLDALVVDPSAALDPKPAWLTYSGYGNHPIVAEFQERRATVWNAPLALRASSEDVVALVRASDDAWAERDQESVWRDNSYSRDSSDSEDVAVALAQEDRRGSRLVLIGSAESMSSVWSERGIGGNDRLLLSALLWVLDREVEITTMDKRPEHLRLLMTESQLRGAFVWCVLVGPLFFGIFGALLWWWRRREK